VAPQQRRVQLEESTSIARENCAFVLHGYTATDERKGKRRKIAATQTSDVRWGARLPTVQGSSSRAGVIKTASTAAAAKITNAHFVAPRTRVPSVNQMQTLRWPLYRRPTDLGFIVGSLGTMGPCHRFISYRSKLTGRQDD
jgi:hypothetical protein